MVTTFKVERGIPLIIDARRIPKYPWREMGVGDSFLFSSCGDAKTQSSASSSASLAGKRHNTKFVTRKTPDGIRVWRVA